MPTRKIGVLRQFFMQEHGTPATVKTYVDGADDAYGIPVPTITTTAIDNVILSFSRRSIREEDGVQGDQYIIEVEIYLLDEEFDLTGMTFPLKIDAKRPEVTIGNGKYDVFETEQVGIGYTRLICRKKRGS